MIPDLRVELWNNEQNEEMRRAFPAFHEATVYAVNLHKDDCVFIPGGWARQVTSAMDHEMSQDRVSEKVLLTYDYGASTPWLNVALS